LSTGFQRALLLHEILGRSKYAEVAFAAPSDFQLRPLRCIDSLRSEHNALIYCFDPVTERALFTLCDDLRPVLRAPFLYQAQFLQARRVATIPFERLAASFGDLPEAKPTLVFSIGRCGSTLLSALLAAIGMRSVSEPDVLTQLAELSDTERACLSPGTTKLLVEACIASLQVHCGDEMVIKLRSQCSRIATEIVAASPEARIVFMLRGRHAWARSRYRAFDESPAFLARLLAWSLSRYHDLVATGRDVKLVWYEDLYSAPLVTLRSIGARASEDLAPRLQAVLARDAQHGSHLSQTALLQNEMPVEALAAFDREWAAICPNGLIARYGLERLL
jgi:hypothetical protein